MRTLTLLLAAIMGLPACTVAPILIPTKHGYIASAGGTLGARRKNFVADIQLPNGARIRTQSEEESSEDVPNNLIAGGVTKHGASVLSHSEDLKTATNGKVALGAQQVDLGKAKLAKDQAVETFVPPR